MSQDTTSLSPASHPPRGLSPVAADEVVGPPRRPPYWPIIAIALLLLTVWALLDSLPRYKRASQWASASKEQREHITNYARTPITLRPEWTRPLPHVSGAKEFHAMLRAWTEDYPARRPAAVHLSDPGAAFNSREINWAIHRANLDEMAPAYESLANVYHDLVRQPNYEFGCWVIYDEPLMSREHWHVPYGLGQYLIFKILVCAAEEQTTEALTTARTLIQGLRRPMMCGPGMHTHTRFHCYWLCEKLSYVVGQSTNTAFLSELSELLRDCEQDAYVHDNNPRYGPFTDIVGNLRVEAARQNWPEIPAHFACVVDLVEYYGTHVTPDHRPREARWDPYWVHLPPQWRQLHREQTALTYWTMGDGLDILSAPAEYRLLRLHVAQRLAVLEGRQEDAESGDPVRLVGEVLIDPFSGEPMRFNPAFNRFYSIGKDRRDDGGTHYPLPYILHIPFGQHVDDIYFE